MALCCALSGLARTAAAQQAAAITVTATVTASYSAYQLQAAPSAARPVAEARTLQWLAIPELGVLLVEGAAAAQVRLDAPAAVGTPRLVRASISFVAN